MSSGWLWGTGGEGFGGGRRPDPEFREQAGVSAIVQAGVLTDPQACVMMESNSKITGCPEGAIDVTIRRD